MDKSQFEVKQKIMRYFTMFTRGCGNPDCRNGSCASNPTVVPVAAEEALKRAFLNLKESRPICSRLKNLYIPNANPNRAPPAQNTPFSCQNGNDGTNGKSCVFSPQKQPDSAKNGLVLKEGSAPVAFVTVKNKNRCEIGGITQSSSEMALNFNSFDQFRERLRDLFKVENDTPLRIMATRLETEVRKGYAGATREGYINF